MVTVELARAYAFLDRNTFFYLKMNERSLLENLLKASETRIKEGNGSKDLRRLCDEGCEREELLWLVSGCCGPAIVLRTQQIFRRGVRLLNRNLQEMRSCADLAASLNGSLFAVLLRGTSFGTTLQSVPESLRALADLAEAAKRDFKNAEWFLSIAKIRLTDHVTYKTHDGKPHDTEVSGLIAAVTGKDYDEDAHRRFRSNPRHHNLFSNKSRDPEGYCSLDPYTVRTDSQRQETMSALVQGMKDNPEFKQAVENYARTFAQLTEQLQPSRANRKISKKSS